MAVDFNENADNMIPTDNPQERSSIRRFAYASAMGWMPDKAAKKVRGGGSNITNPTHPIFNISISKTLAVLKYFYNQ